ncbi:methyltransferase type 11 [Gemmatimonadetes bacterium T265]|nr:methyltransferase type 11 [Gemmatimonadetes bacterium T265]
MTRGGKGGLVGGAVAALVVLGTGCRPRTADGAGGGTPPAARADAPNDSIAVRGPAGAAADRFPAPSRPVSSIVAPRWSDEDDRDQAGEAERVLALAGVKAGTQVADIGAGDGYYTVRAAPLVGATGRVWAEDIEARYLELLQKRLRARPQPNVVLALGEPHDPRLPTRSADVALLIHMYHEISQPFGLLYNLYASLRPGARVVILDTTRPTDRHGTPPALLRCELGAMGYEQTRTEETGPGEYVAVFAPPATAAALTAPERVAGRLAALGCARIARQAAGGT